ncbi:MAG: murein biosynthesis integral membrane protein MurJ [Phycisphaerales bacterium]
MPAGPATNPLPAPAAPTTTPPPPGAAGLAGAVRALSGVTLLSRLGGLARDLLLARLFGATAIGSAFNAGFAIPNLFRRLFGEGALSAAFIPEYAQAHKADASVYPVGQASRLPGRADQLASLTVLWLLLVTTALTVLIELALLAALLLLPYDPARALSFKLIMLMLPFMPLVCTAAILGGMLQVHGRYGPSATGPLLLNAFIIAVAAWSLLTRQLGTEATAYLLGLATVLSGLTQCAWFALLLRPHIQWTRAYGDARDSAKRMARRFVPVLVGMGTLQINAFLDILLAMWPIWVGPTILGLAYPMDDASNAILTFTQRLYQFPLGVFGIAVATAVFPMLARHADEPGEFLSTLRRGLRLSLFIGLPASIGLLLVRTDLTTVLFGGGRHGFGPGGLARSAAVLAGFAPAVWAYSLNHVLTRAFYARGDMRTPMKVALAIVALNLALNLILIWPLREAGLAWATTISATIQCVILAILLSRSLAAPLLDAPTRAALLRTTAAALAMGAAVIVIRFLLPAPTTWTGHHLLLSASCAIGLAAYPLAAAAFGAPELRWLLRRAA